MGANCIQILTCTTTLQYFVNLCNWLKYTLNTLNLLISINQTHYKGVMAVVKGLRNGVSES